jgi:hypothetical protein
LRVYLFHHPGLHYPVVAMSSEITFLPKQKSPFSRAF